MESHSETLRNWMRADEGTTMVVPKWIVDDLLNDFDKLEWRSEVANRLLDVEQQKVANVINILTGIYALLYPAPVTRPDGATMVFRPSSPDPHEIMQELSDRIRAVPKQIEALRGPQ